MKTEHLQYQTGMHLASKKNEKKVSNLHEIQRKDLMDGRQKEKRRKHKKKCYNIQKQKITVYMKSNKTSKETNT